MKKHGPQDTSPDKNFNFINIKNQLPAFVGWLYYILERLTILYAISSNFSQPPFQPITPFIPDEPYLSPSSHTEATIILSPQSSNEPDAPSPIIVDQNERNLDNIKSQQIHDTNNSFTIHQLTHSASTSKFSTPSVHIAPTRAQKVSMKRKHPNAAPQFLIRCPGSSRI